MFEKLNRTLAVVALGLVSPAAGAPGFMVLNAPAAAAPAGTAGAVAAARGEPWCAAVNPAGLAFLKEASTSLHGRSSQQNVFQEGVLHARPGAWAVAAGASSVGGLTRTRYDPSSPDRFSTAGSVRAGAVYAGAFRAGAFSADGAWGAGAKLVREDLDDRAAWTVAFDAGLVGRWDDRIRMGLALRNAGPPGRFSSGKVRPPARVQGGLRYSSADWAAWEADLVHAFGAPGELLLGAAFNRDSAFFLRAGYRHRFRANGLEAWGNAVAGMGVRRGRFDFDYAFQPFGEYGDSHEVSFSWRWGDDRPRRAPTTP